MTTEFVPERMTISEDYRKDDLTNAYADAGELGLWIKEWEPIEEGKYLCAVGSYYHLQQLEHDNPEIGDLDPQEFSFADCVALAHPGSGDSRVAAIRDGIRAFKEGPMWEQQVKWQEQVNKGEQS